MKIAALALVASGCSFVFVEGPPSNYQHMTDFHCTSSEVPPMIDAILVGANALSLSLVASHQYRIQDESVEKTVIAIDAVLIAVHVASAIYGFVRTETCQEAMATLSARRPHRFQNFLPPAPPPPAPPAPTEAVPAAQEEPAPPPAEPTPP
jgi:hypothetical protein